MTNSINLIDINGKIDTSKTILDNLNEIATNSQSFLSWDPTLGQWTVRLNRPVTNIIVDRDAHFDDDNIIGAISVTGSGITEKFNAIKATYNANDLSGEKDDVYFEVPIAERYSNELDNEISKTYSLVNTSIQAERLAAIELNQARVDKIISFKTDYRSINLKAGMIVTITNEQYNYSNKAWRIVEIEEIDDSEGAIIVGITAIEYYTSTYDIAGLVRPERNRDTGIVPAESNMCVFEKDIEKLADDLQQPAAKAATNRVVYDEQSDIIPIAGDSTATDTDMLVDFVVADNVYETGLTFTAPYAGKFEVQFFFTQTLSFDTGGDDNFILPTDGETGQVCGQRTKNSTVSTFPFGTTRFARSPALPANIITPAKFVQTAAEGDVYQWKLSAVTNLDASHPDGTFQRSYRMRVVIELIEAL